jgi:hypothetical protein
MDIKTLIIKKLKQKEVRVPDIVKQTGFGPGHVINKIFQELKDEGKSSNRQSKKFTLCACTGRFN